MLINKDMAKGVLFHTDILDKIEDAAYVQLESSETKTTAGIQEQTLIVLNQNKKRVYVLKIRQSAEIRENKENTDRTIPEGKTMSERCYSFQPIKVQMQIRFNSDQQATRIEILSKYVEGARALPVTQPSLTEDDILTIAREVASCIQHRYTDCNFSLHLQADAMALNQEAPQEKGPHLILDEGNHSYP